MNRAATLESNTFAEFISALVIAYPSLGFTIEIATAGFMFYGLVGLKPGRVNDVHVFS